MSSSGAEPVRLLAERTLDEHPSFPSSARGRTLDRSGPQLTPAETAVWLRKVPLFARLDPRSISLLTPHVEDRCYAADGAVSGARGGDHALLIVVSGTLEGPDRALFGPGAVLHEPALFSDQPAPVVMARTDVRVLELRASVFVDRMREHFDLFLGVARKLAEDAMASDDAYGPDLRALDAEGIVERMDILRAVLPCFARHASACAQLASASRVEQRGAGALLIGADAVCRSIAVVLRGEVEHPRRAGANGPGAAIGLLEALLEIEPPRARARGSVEVLVLSSDDLFDLLEEHSALEPAFLRFLHTFGEAGPRSGTDLAA